MPDRLVLVVTPERVPDLPSGREGESVVEVHARWDAPTADGRHETKLLIDAADSDAVIDALHERFEGHDDYRLLLFDVLASLPRPEEGEAVGEDEREDGGEGEEEDAPPERIGREELYRTVADGAGVSARYLVLTALATVVAAFGMMRDDAALVIGAMVIAPLLGPNVAMALAATLADGALARKAFWTGFTGLLLALGLALLTGLVFEVPFGSPQIASRASISVGDAGLAVAAGAAGALAFTGGASAGVIGVMVAVALLPPVVAAGLLLADGHVRMGLDAAMLVAVNLLGVNLAGIATFLVQGVRPSDFREAGLARRASLGALALWALLLGALIAVVLLRPEAVSETP